MCDQPQLTGEEWGLLVELLEQELSDLSPEIRHTRTASVRDDLRTRQQVVQSLLQRLRSAVTA